MTDPSIGILRPTISDEPSTLIPKLSEKQQRVNFFFLLLYKKKIGI